MDLNELLETRKTKIEELENLLVDGKAEKRELNEEENEKFNAIKSEIENIDKEIETKNNNTNKENRNMENFSDLIVRNGEKVENFEVRGLVLSSGIDDVQVAGNISSVGYKPFYKEMGCEILPNLSSSIKLPYVGNVIGAKKNEGEANDNAETISTVLLQPKRYTLTETVGKEILAVGNEQAFQAFLYEMAKGVDKSVTKDVFDVVIAGASELTGLTAYTTTAMDSLVSEVDGDVTVLMPRAEFYSAKGVKADTGSGLFLANKDSQFRGHFWDGTPLFYSNLFSGSTIAVADLAHVTIGEFGESYEVIIDQLSKAPEGQVKITVVKVANVVLRNASAVKKATVA